MVTFEELTPLSTSTTRIAAFCTAKSYLLKALFEAIKSRYKTIWYKDCIYIDLAPNDSLKVKEVFFFSYGVTIFWGFEEQEELAFLRGLKPFENEPLDAPERELMTFTFGPTQKIEEDEITLPDTEHLSRLAISHGIAQSVKLAVFEYAIQKTIDKTKNIPEQLAAQGKIPLSKVEIRKKMGELFIERSYVNLHSDVLDLPDFFWDHSDVEPLYRLIANNLDLKTRIEILNQRLDTVHDLFEMLGNELNHQHSSRLEWIIIWLIVIEVALTLSRDVFNIL
jgi:uncharacterized Rmd1/YagE family protein